MVSFFIVPQIDTVGYSPSQSTLQNFMGLVLPAVENSSTRLKRSSPTTADLGGSFGKWLPVRRSYAAVSCQSS